MKSASSRRDFLKTATAGAAALSVTAASYGRVVGANERIAIGVIGCGGRGRGADRQASNVLDEIAVHDCWKAVCYGAGTTCRNGRIVTLANRPARVYGSSAFMAATRFHCL